ncbi:MAG: hypothetical protein C0467_26230 [Planctomycetaceae bacterium]|nr:hypothetical protein [Planctomycetaceae bacterium]
MDIEILGNTIFINSKSFDSVLRLGVSNLLIINAAVLEELDELGRLDWDQLVADATFVRGKKGATRSGTPSGARA